MIETIASRGNQSDGASSKYLKSLVNLVFSSLKSLVLSGVPVGELSEERDVRKSCVRDLFSLAGSNRSAAGGPWAARHDAGRDDALVSGRARARVLRLV